MKTLRDVVAHLDARLDARFARSALQTMRVGLALAAGALLAAPAHAAEVGVSVHISQPGVYGRVDIGRFPQPQVVLSRPVIIQRQVVVMAPEPVYMWVPPGHRKHWKKHCKDYGACGVPVYFVQDGWYGTHVRDSDRDDDRGHGKYKDKDKNKGKGHGKGEGGDKHRD